MNPTLPNKQRRGALSGALKRIKPEERLSLDDLAMLWGTAKTRFVNVKQQMIRDGFDFPPPEKGAKNANLYHGKPALEVMLAYETRNDQSAHQKDKAIKAILGQQQEQDSAGVLSISELAILNREAARAEERAREQGKHSLLSDQAAVAAEVFSMITDFFGDLDAQVDPNGQLDKEIRAKLRTLGHDAQIKLHDKMKELLSDEPRSPNQKRRKSSRRAN